MALVLLAGALLGSVGIAPLAGAATLADLEVTAAPVATRQQSHTIKLIHYVVDKSHYRPIPLDDGFSELVWEAYIDSLDPGKSVFMQADIDQFWFLRQQMDDIIRDGNLNPIFDIFRRLRTRMEERVSYALERLDRPFDFTLEEDYLFDREDANWVTSTEELDDLWRKRIKNDFLNLRLTDKDNAAIIDSLKQRYTHLTRRIRQFKSDDVFQTFANAYINTLEPHTSYFSPRAVENFNIHMSLSLEGIGAVLQTNNEYTEVRRIIPGGPADLGHELKVEDRIIGVAQWGGEIVDVIGWRLDDVVDLIRGAKDSIVRLEILPGENAPSSQIKVISIRRDKINLDEQAAKKRILQVETDQGKSTIGVIDLPSFYVDLKRSSGGRSTTDDVRELVNELKADGIDGLIIDLRGNGGGALTEAIDLVGLFIREGPVVQVRNSRGDVQVHSDIYSDITYNGPLAVLVDRYSASASEIFASAVQDYRRGLVIGEPTFGKGTVQNLVDLDRFAKDDSKLGQLKVTSAQFFRINGGSTQHRGVVPDIIWPMAPKDADFGERAYDNAIPWREIRGAQFDYFRNPLVPVVLERALNLHAQRIRTSPEFAYFREVTKITDERRDKKTITLNEDIRTRERVRRDEQRLQLENRMRRALGREIASSIEALDEEAEEKLRAIEGNRIAQEPDALLREGGNILGDYLHIAQSSDPEGGAIANKQQP